jgi:hypothetical protein
MLSGLIVTINNRVLPVAVPMCLALLGFPDMSHLFIEAEAEIFRYHLLQLQISVHVSFQEARWIMPPAT